jgi:adenylate cyclase
MHEIERKFLLRRPARTIVAEAQAAGTLLETFAIEQRYLSDAGDWTLRCRRIIRPTSTTCFLTMKRRVTDRKCIELETVVDCRFYDQMASQCGPTLTKTRSKIEVGHHVWEIDIFDNPELAGLEIAEIELSSEKEKFAMPSWAGKDVTSQKRYKNARLVRQLAA